MIHIDKYNITAYGKEFKNGKESKQDTVLKTLSSKDCISGNQFLQLLSDLDDAWHIHEGKDVEISVKFITPNR